MADKCRYMSNRNKNLIRAYRFAEVEEARRTLVFGFGAKVCDGVHASANSLFVEVDCEQKGDRQPANWPEGK